VTATWALPAEATESANAAEIRRVGDDALTVADLRAVHG